MKILLVGFYGEGNLGDNAILRAIKENLPIGFCSYVTAGKLYEQKDKIYRRGFISWKQYIETALKCDKSVFSGGILQDWSVEGVLFFALRIFAASALKCKPSLWGAGIGPLRSKAMKSIAKKALMHTETSWVRDISSANLYEELTGKKCNIGADWTWHYPCAYNFNGNDERVIVNFRPWIKYLPIQEEIKSKFSNRELVGLAARNEDAFALRKSFPNMAVTHPKDFGELLEYVSMFKEGAAMRYHIALAMIRAGVKTTLIPYDSKVEELKTAQADLNKFISDNALNYERMAEKFKSYLI